MPLDLNCPKCNHVFPVTEAKHPVDVQCPGCEAHLTAEFRKRPAPVAPGQHPYELLVSVGRPTAVPPALPRKKLHIDEAEAKERAGGGMAVVILAGVGALLIALGGLGATGYVLFTNLDTSDSTLGSVSSGGGTNTKGTNNPKVTNPKNKGKPGTPEPDPFQPPDPFVPPVPPKPKDRFDLKPVVGPAPKITATTLPADPFTIDLGGKVRAIAVGGAGRYIVMHIPDKGQLAVFDASTGKASAVAADNGEARLAAGLSRAVLYATGPKVFRVYSLPDLSKQYDASFDLFFGANSLAMGSKTNGPLLVEAGFGEVRLFDIAGSSMTEIEEAKGKPGIHGTPGGLRASPDGTAFATFDGFHGGQKTTILTHANRQWRVQRDVNQTPFPGMDGNFYGNGVVINQAGQDQRFGGVGAGSNQWYVPATSNGNYFLKITPTTIGKAPRDKKTIAVTVHGNKNANVPVAGTPTFTGLPEYDELIDPWGNLAHDKSYDQHFFLIPEAKLLVTLSGSRDKLVLRRVNVP
jgi:hypothetical protein